MNNKCVKIVIIAIMVVLALLLFTSKSMAVINYNGTTYYTKNDISWMTSYILWNGEKYYCINHGWYLNKNLTGDDMKLTIEKTGHTVGLVFKGADLYRKAISTAENSANAEIDSEKSKLLKLTYDTAQIKSSSVTPVSHDTGTYVAKYTSAYWNAVASAIYGFAGEEDFGITPYSSTIQNAIWNLEYSRGNDCNWGGENYLWDAAQTFVDWSGPNLTSDSSNANININYNNSTYVVGPLTVSYDSGFDRDGISFTRNISCIVTDQNNREISNVKIIDSNGNTLGSIPNGTNFYLEFPYSTDITKVNIKVTLDYISSTWGKETDYITEVQYWNYTEFDSEITAKISVEFYDNVMIKTKEEMEKLKRDDPYSWTQIVNIQGYTSWKLWAILHITEYSTSAIQNMRRISGGVEWSETETSMSIDIPTIDKEMDIAGYVWNDMAEGKDSSFNGSKDSTDTMLENIEVRLYTKDGELATVNNGTNPTLTDKNGHYEFKGVNPTKKYYVVFTYDGMIYTNTYGAGVPEYNTTAWNNSSKGSEVVSERNTFNNKFVSIGSYPKAYKVSEILFKDYKSNYLTSDNNKTYYNKTYSINEDKELLEKYQTLVAKQLATYLKSNDRLEDGTTTYVNAIYWPIINSISDTSEKYEAMSVLQYIWDCRINAYANNESVQDGNTTKITKTYPYYDKFILVDDDGNRLTATSESQKNGYWIIYNGQLYINLGLIRRENTDLELTEDLNKTVVSINGKDETYTYGTLSKKRISLNESDYAYTQNIAKDDYSYSTDTDTKDLASDLREAASYDSEEYAPLQVYATYKIQVKNNTYMPTSVDEIVTYFEKYYFSYSDSYTTTGGMTISGIEAKFLSTSDAVETDLSKYDADNFGMKVSASSKYGTKTETGVSQLDAYFVDPEDMYISFDETLILEHDQSLILYITYRLGEDSTTNSTFNCIYATNQSVPNGLKSNSAKLMLQDLLAEEGAEIKIKTVTEINGYSTFYKKTTDASTTRTKYSSYYTYTSATQSGSTYRAAGILDALSIPGNLATRDSSWDEDDYDTASTLVLKNGGSRTLTGNVWETDGYASDWYGDDYATYNSSKVADAEDITVELIELVEKDGKIYEYVRAYTRTDANGTYTIEKYIPGNYVIRFTYGDREQYSKYSDYTYGGHTADMPYNGQFYQSAKANPETNDNQYWYANNEDTRYSDAYDEANIRKDVNDDITEYTYWDATEYLENMKTGNCMVYAYTSMLDVCVEYATTSSTSSDSDPGYEIYNVDFGLTKRTEAKLEINKEVTHLKLVLQNGMVYFDVDTTTIQEQGVSGVVQAAQGFNINIQMSSELVNGATLEITYTITVKNNSGYDSVTYYKDSSGNVIAVALYEEAADKLVYYEDGSIRTYSNGSYQDAGYGKASYKKAGTTTLVAIDTRKTETQITKTGAKEVVDFVSNNLNFINTDYNGSVVNEDWEVKTMKDTDKDNFVADYYTSAGGSYKDIDSEEVYDTKTIVMANDNNALLTELEPGASVSETIVLSKVISVESKSSDTKSYNNKVRILKMFNTVSKIGEPNGNETKTSEKVIISDPTGIGNIYIVIGLVLVVVALIGVGVILIKKFVMARK